MLDAYHNDLSCVASRSVCTDILIAVEWSNYNLFAGAGHHLAMDRLWLIYNTLHAFGRLFKSAP